MIALYANDTREIKISGSKEDWKLLGSALLTDKEEKRCKIVNNPEPYTNSIEKILIQHNKSDQILIDVNSDDYITISGSLAACTGMSQLIQSFASEYQPTEHFHFDSVDSHLVDIQSAYAVFYIE